MLNSNNLSSEFEKPIEVHEKNLTGLLEMWGGTEPPHKEKNPITLLIRTYMLFSAWWLRW